MKFEDWYKSKYKGNDPVFKMHIESAWNAAVEEASEALEIEYRMLGDIYTSRDLYENATNSIDSVKAI